MENTILVPTNKYQTPITEELLSQYPDEVREQFMEFISTVPFIQNLISPSRPKIEELPRDDKGRAIVDITNPPIFEDADYFRQSALYFLENGCYTKLRPNSNPNSEYRKFWDREIDRCYNGLLRESDGMWIPGQMYWFLNYEPMLINEIQKGSKKAIRKEAFAYFFEGIWFRYLYINKARESGHHAIELAKRGAHPYDAKVYTPEGVKKWEDINIGDKLFGTYGNITTVIDIPFNNIAPVYKITLKDGRTIEASDEHKWNVGISSKRRLNVVTTTDMFNDSNFKLKSGLYKYAIPNNLGVNYDYKEVPIDAYTLGLYLGDGRFKGNVIELTQDYNDLQDIKQYIPYPIKQIGKDGLHYSIYILNCKQYMQQLGLNNTKSNDKFIPDLYKYNSKEIRLNLLKGLMDTDGWQSLKRSPQYCTISYRLKNDIIELARSLGYKVFCNKKKSGYKKNNIYIKCNDSYTITIVGGEELFNMSRKKEIAKQLNPTFKPFTSIVEIEFIGYKNCKCVEVDSEDHSYLIGEYINTRNCAKSYSLAGLLSHNLILGESTEAKKRTVGVLTASQKEYLKDDKDGTLSKFIPILSFLSKNTPFPRLMLKQSSNEMTWQMGYKDEYGNPRGSLNMVLGVSAKDDSDKATRGKRGWIFIEEMGNFSNLLELYDVTRKSVEDGDFTFGLIYLVGTANNKESNFLSAKTLLYAPQSYNIQEINNVYDKKGQGKQTFGFFFASYLNRAGCYNKDGISDVVLALLQILMNRYKAKYGADPTSVLRVIAEDPITPAEAIIKVKDAYFPVASLQERAQKLDTDSHAYDDIYVGELYFNQQGEVAFRPTEDKPIRTFPVDNDTRGALEIYNMPEKNSSGKIFSNRYIIGVDPYDNDQAESSSLYSIFVFDLFTDKPVAEYTGRTMFANDAHEIVRKLCLFYNAKALYESNRKGIFSYMEANRSTYLLADTPEYLRDKQMIKYSSFGSNQKGVNASAVINNYANSLIKDWLNKLTPVLVKDEEGNESTVQIPMLYTLRNRALIEELIQFNPEINVDRVRAFGILMIYREEFIIKYGNNMNNESREKLSNSYAGNDNFFTKNYRNRF